MKKLICFILLITGVLTTMFGQVFNPVRWETTVEKQTLLFTARIDDGWSIYALHIPDEGPIPTSFEFANSAEYELLGEAEEVTKSEVKYDESFKMNVGKFKHTAVFRQKIKALSDKPFTVKGSVIYMCCNDNSCLPPNEVEFAAKVTPEQQTAPSLASTPIQLVAPEQIDTAENIVAIVDESATNLANPALVDAENSLWAFILLALSTGLLGVLTPCVYPVIPLTISFFMRNEQRRTKTTIFGLSIVLIFTLIGVIAALTKSADFTNQIVGHWLTNLIFAAVFIFFALWFLGLFEISLSGSLANKLDQKANKGGYISAFFMALGLVVVSFSCTGPFIGTILVASAQGLAVKPIFGMAAFGLGFALPFTFLAFFPSLLKKMPKSGGWMNSVKVVFAFIMLAFALYFFTSVDRSFGWNIVSRNGFLCIWTVLFALMGVYLLGKIRFANDSEVKSIGIVRLLFAIAAFTFSLYLFTGLLGEPLPAVSSLLPEASHTSRKNVAASVISPAQLCGVPKYSDKLSFPLGLQGYFDYDEAIACAKKQNKPVLMVFKGHGCAKCREMEANIWTDGEVLNLLNEKFILLALYTDDDTPLPEAAHFTSAFDGKVKKTLGQKNTDIEITRYQTNAFPYYAILTPDGETVGKPMGYTGKVEEFRDFLKR
ncbi:MAG: thioredoxin family protein [Bacteroidales bacterium]|jgi:thiol:disulfide interchange protein DsbD|nr:thioredoxin family protein [Bacteroidales bacterium]